MSKEWKEYTIVSISSRMGDAPFGANLKTKDYTQDGVVVIQGKNIQGRRMNWDNLRFVSHEKFHSLSKHKVRTKALVFPKVGTIGKVGIVTKYKDQTEFLLSTNSMMFEPNEEIAFSLFVYYYFSWERIRKKIELDSSSSVQPVFNYTALKNFPINLPPLQEQKAIAHILGTLDDKIELNRKMNETLEAMAQAMFKSWFVDFDPVLDNALAQGNTIPDALQAKAERRKAVLASGKYKALPAAIRGLFPASFVYNEELGKWIPKGWESSSIGKEFNVTMGQSPPSSTYNETEIGIPFFQGKTDFGFRFPTNRIFCTEPKRLANKNDTLISVRAPVGSANLAHCNCAIGRGVAALRHKSLSISYTYQTVLNLKSKFDVFEGEGTVFGSINQSDLKALGVVKSNKQIIKTFDFYCSKLDKRIELNSHDINTLTKTRDLLLSQLISGKTRLPESFVQQF